MAGLYGGHSPDGTVGLWGPGIHSGQTLEGAQIEDLAPTILYLLGHPVPEYMDGTPLLRAMALLAAQHPVEYEDSGHQERETEPEEVYSPEDRQAVEGRLKDLGYI